MSQFYPEYAAIHGCNKNVRYSESCRAAFHSLLVASEFCFLFACFLIGWLCFVGFHCYCYSFFLFIWNYYDLDCDTLTWFTQISKLWLFIVCGLWIISPLHLQLRLGLFYKWKNGQECKVFAYSIDQVRLKGVGSGWICIHSTCFTGMKSKDLIFSTM